MTTSEAWHNKGQWLDEFGAVAGIPHPAVHMGVALWRFASSKPPFRCWPSVASLAQYMGVSETRAHELLQDLRLAGWVSVDRRAGGRRLTNMYELVRGNAVWPTAATVQRRASRQPARRSSDEPEVADLFRSSDEPEVETTRRPPVEAVRRPPVEAMAPAVPTSRSTGPEPRNPPENPSDAVAGPAPNVSPVRGLEDVPEIAWHRHSADARDGDDADAIRHDTSPVVELVGRLAEAQRIPS